MKEWLDDSIIVPRVLAVRDKIPGDTLGLIPGEFETALNTMEADLVDNVDS